MGIFNHWKSPMNAPFDLFWFDPALPLGTLPQRVITRLE
jgi:hypothetical protein